jgi:hypothetical protein
MIYFLIRVGTAHDVLLCRATGMFQAYKYVMLYQAEPVLGGTGEVLLYTRKFTFIEWPRNLPIQLIFTS